LNIITSIRNRIISLFYKISIPNRIFVRQRLRNMIFWSYTILIFIEICIRRTSMISSPNILIYKLILAARWTFRKTCRYIYDWKRMLIPKALHYCINLTKFLLMNELSLIQHWTSSIIKMNSNESSNRHLIYFQSL
jgi:hypothetical protein